MSFVIYHIDTTKFLRIHTKKYAGAVTTEYATRTAALAALAREAKKGKINTLEYAIADKATFHAEIEKKEIRHGVAMCAGKEYEVGVNTPWSSGPWSEAYFSM
jgi:hypothetical protein